MSNNVRLEVLLNAVDRASRPLKAIQTASKTLSSDIRNTQKSLSDLNAQAARIEDFRKTSAQFAQTGRALNQAKQEAAALAIQFKNTQAPTLAQARALETAKRAAADLQLKYNGLRQSVQNQRSELQLAGINTRTLSADDRRLKASIGETTAQLNRQRDALARVSAQQARLKAVKARHESGRQLAAGVRAAGTAGVGVATAGLSGIGRFIAPGIDFDKQMSGIQATLGLNKDDGQLAAIRKQALESSYSPGQVAQTQTILAQSGYDADGVLAATGSTLNLSRAADVDVAEAADIITTMQSSFNLSMADIGRVADVMTKGFTSSGTGLTELAEAMKNAAPSAAAAGASIEDTTAMLGILAENGIKGATAGAGASAMFHSLQAPQGQAVGAMQTLGVSTRDAKGNMLPIENILKDIHTAFAKNSLGTAQQGDYLKAIFGEEATGGATKLVAAAGDGSLAGKRQQLAGSKGSTERIAQIRGNNLDGDVEKMQAAWEKLQIEGFGKEETVLRRLAAAATDMLGKVDAWAKANPGLTQTLFTIVTGGLALVGVLGGIGMAVWPVIAGINGIMTAASVLSTVFAFTGSAIMAALSAITLPVLAVAAAVVAGVLLIRKYWEPIGAFFTGVVEGLKIAFAPAAEMFAPVGQVFDTLSEKLGAVWQWFTDLLAPVKATQETLDSCKNVGVAFGEALANALTAPLNVFNSLSSKAGWLLEKLGIIKKESSNLDQTAATAQGAAPNGSYIPATSTYGGYQGYQMVTNSAGRSFFDQSRSEYNITLQGGVAPGGDFVRQVQEAVEELDRKQRSRQRASMTHD